MCQNPIGEFCIRAHSPKLENKTASFLLELSGVQMFKYRRPDKFTIHSHTNVSYKVSRALEISMVIPIGKTCEIGEWHLYDINKLRYMAPLLLLSSECRRSLRNMEKGNYEFACLLHGSSPESITSNLLSKF